MKKRTSAGLVCIIAVLFVASSQNLESQSPIHERHAKSGNTVSEVPGFAVKVSFSKKANDELTSRSETVVVVGYLSGFPKLGTPKRLLDGQIKDTIWLGEVEGEFMPGSLTTFNRIKLDQSRLKWVDHRGPQLLINVFSGRKSSPDNLLSCDTYEGSLQSVQGRDVEIFCKLIREQ
ncbi:MAG TPA: hypothetical protein VGR47_02125 [Terracidiphilus sp.]|nr:hypothetical protein [Terracidiphilus sp.]